MAEPITVGGGGGRGKPGRRARLIFTAFRDADYPDPGGVKKKKTYACTSGATMKTLFVKLGTRKIDLSMLCPDPADGECTVEIQAKGGDEHILISGTPLRVELNTDKYPPEKGDKHESSDGTNFIRRITVNSPFGRYESPALTAGDAVEVLADTF